MNQFLEIKLFNHPNVSKVNLDELKEAPTCEALARHIAINTLNVKPASLELFAIKAGKYYLAPNHVLKPQTDTNLELRLRFKVPNAVNLSKFDQAAFLYFYKQIHYDFLAGSVLPGQTQIEKEPSGDQTFFSKMVAALGDDDKSDEAVLRRTERVTFFTNVLKLSSLTMFIDIMEKTVTMKTALKNFEDYLPKQRLWTGIGERMLGLKKLKPSAENVIESWINQKFLNAPLAKIEFVDNVAEFFPNYFEEIYEAILLKNNGYIVAADSAFNNQKVRLILNGPFKSPNSSLGEIEPKLELEEVGPDGRKRSYKNRSGSATVEVCAVDDLCYISLLNIEPEKESKNSTRVSLARKNGIPVFFQFMNDATMVSFITALSGYYRLCEKWTFNLCSDIPSPTLEFLGRNHIHGPVSAEFVDKKFTSSDKRCTKGNYLLRMSPEKHDIIHLHYIPNETNAGRFNVINIERTKDKQYKLSTQLPKHPPELEAQFDDVNSLVKAIKQTGVIDLQNCLHPSEYDKCSTISLCRAIAKLEEDIVGRNHINMSDHPLLISFKALSKFENKHFDGKFTNVWQGRWSKSRSKKETVAIKQLKSNYGAEKLMEFMEACVTRATSWEDNSLVKIYGSTLASRQSPMALIMEFFPLGPLNLYLQANKDKVDDVNLVESTATLARAMWYLEENSIIHSNIRCRNIFVAKHETNGLTVKLGDSGIPDYSGPGEIHFLPIEMFDDRKHSSCTTQGDVWAFGTTMWQIFSYGIDPLVDMDPEVARIQYIHGNRLPRPAALSLAIYEDVMLGCWRPNPQERKSPREIMKDMNQLLYRVLNTKRIHTYHDIDKGRETASSTATGTAATTMTESYRYDSFPQDDVEISLAPALPPKNPSFLPSYNKSTDDEVSLSHLQEFGTFSCSGGLVPTFNEMMYKFREKTHMFSNPILPRPGGGVMTSSGSGVYGHNQPLLQFSGDSRSASSMEGSLFSQFTSQTSLASLNSLYSMSSIYQLSNESQLELSYEFPLGEGNFGVVYKGVLLRSNGEWDQVAVKMLKGPAASSEAAHELHRELEIMKSLNHENVVKIKAVLADQGIIIMEFIREGSLDRYVQAHKDELNFPSQFFIYAQNILDGMDYLTNKGIIHRDLAARNILVASEELVKISDFGLARSMQDDKDVYVMSTQTNIPVKWHAFECLKQNVYSTYSDVWSFGVVLWEMFAFGKSPALAGCEDFFQVGASYEKLGEHIQTWLRKLEEGSRFPLPDKCPVLVYTELMLPCWHIDPKSRPLFSELRSRLDKIELQVT